MAELNIKGYNVRFPYPVPYDIQKDYMEKVLTCLDDKTHAVLESPTGTGKTLCLFAPVTAWAKQKKLQNVTYVTQDSEKEFSSYFDQKDQQGNWGNKRRAKVWYTSRTHSQIAQTVSEVRKCNVDGLQVRVMGARDQLCINKLVLEEKDSYVKTVKCKELVKGKQCKYYSKLTYEKDIQKFYQGGDVLDIEDLVSVGKTCGVCPYFLAKRATETADIVLLPYNYIIDKDSREANGLYLQDDVIIFDEGHNIPSTCEESYEFNITSLDVAMAINNVKELMLTLTKLSDTSLEDDEIDLAAHASNTMMIMEVLRKLESQMEDLPTANELLPVSSLIKFLEDAGISEKTSKQLMDGLSLFKSDSDKLTLSGSILNSFNLLEKILNVMFGPTVKSFDQDTIDKSFKCGITFDPGHANNVKKLSLYCFNPSFGIKNLLQQGVQSIIITSGTLSPMKTFISELGLPNAITLENGHIAKKCQVPFVILGTGVNNVRMDGSFKNRTDPKYVSSLGMTLTNLICSVPDGVLLLFSSYSMMQNLKDTWQSDITIWPRLNSLKRVFMEPRNKDDFINCMENYKRAIDSGNGAILMGVLRGKISEGMDFKDQYCRGVFIIGVPFPPVKDPRVIGKEKYAESLMVFNPTTKSEEKLYNIPFMSVEAMKATNQAIGRVIRHGRDYGVIVLVDYRFASPRLFQNISHWLRGDTPVEGNFQTTKKLVRDFFKDIHTGKMGVEEIRCQEVDGNGCPVAGFVQYQEYDHKKTTWIGGDSLPSQPTKRPRWQGRGHANVEYVGEDAQENSQNLISMYRKSGEKSKSKSKSEARGESKNSGKSGSLLDALENSKSSSNVGYGEPEKSNLGLIWENYSNKRKSDSGLDDDDEGSMFREKTPRTNCSPSMLSFPESSQKSQPKKFHRIKVRPLIPKEENEFENPVEIAKPEGSSNRDEKKKEEEELKVKLIDYYRQAKQSLSKEHEQAFKTSSCKYMKGEAKLCDVIRLMDECFLTPGKKNLFAGFEICVKRKDKDEWREACKVREIDLTDK